MSIDYRVGDTRELVRAIPDGSVSLVASSPPFIALRSYLPADHPDKHAEIGSEPDPATFLDTLLGLTAEWGRVLAPWGSIAIELGDTYSGSSQGGGDLLPGSGIAQPKKLAMADALTNKTRRSGEGWPRAKSLALIPQLYAIALAYGRNPLTGAPSPAGQWLVRNVIVWHRPNPAVGALGDKYRPSTSYIVVATRTAKRWFDLTAVRTTPTIDPAKMMPGSPSRDAAREAVGLSFGIGTGGNPAGAPPLDAWFDNHDTWTITTQPSRLAHYAMWPPKLAERLVLSMCPAEVCATCGEPRRRVERIDGLVDNKGRQVERVNWPSGMDHVDPVTGKRTRVVDGDLGGALGAMSLKKTGGTTTTTTTIGWTDCGHGNFIPGTVLDPFGGTATTGLVAEHHGRNAICLDLDPRNADLVNARRTEVVRALTGRPAPDPAQLDLFGATA